MEYVKCRLKLQDLLAYKNEVPPELEAGAALKDVKHNLTLKDALAWKT